MHGCAGWPGCIGDKDLIIISFSVTAGYALKLWVNIQLL
jgi:hypothetical protein